MRRPRVYRTFFLAGRPGMSALGQKQTCAVQTAMSALPPKADIRWKDRRGARIGHSPRFCCPGAKATNTNCGPATPRERASCAASPTSRWLHLSRGIDFGFLGDRLSICLIFAGVLPRMSYPRRSSSAIASRLSSSTVFLRGAMMAHRIGTPEPRSLCQPSQKVRFLLAIREIYRQDY